MIWSASPVEALLLQLCRSGVVSIILEDLVDGVDDGGGRGIPTAKASICAGIRDLANQSIDHTRRLPE